MKLQASTDYAVRILQYLHENAGEVYPAMSIAESVGITYPFFIKIANQLKKKKLINAVQGRNGGYTLGKPAGEISLYDVFRAIEGDLILNHCLNGRPCTRGKHIDCKFHSVLRGVQGNIITELSSRTIADVAS